MGNIVLNIDKEIILEGYASFKDALMNNGENPHDKGLVGRALEYAIDGATKNTAVAKHTAEVNDAVEAAAS